MSEELQPTAGPASATTRASPQMFYAHEERAPRPVHEAVIANLFGLKGRFTRESYWLVYAGCVFAALVSPLLGSVIFWPLLIALTWVSSAAVVKRFHDRGKHGAWWLVSLIPFVGTLWILVECGMLVGDPEANEYGPKGLAPIDLLR